MASDTSAGEIREEPEAAEQEFTPEECVLLTELEKKHRRVRGIKVEKYGLVVFATASRKQWQKYQRDRADARTDAVTVEENLLRECLVYPKTPGILDTILDDFPGLQSPFSYTVATLSGGDNDEVKLLGKDWKRPVATT